MLSLVTQAPHGFVSIGPAPSGLPSVAAATASAPVCMVALGGSSKPAGLDQKTRRLTKALFWTESYFDQQEQRTLSRVQTAEPSELQKPCAPPALLHTSAWGGSSLPRARLARVRRGLDLRMLAHTCHPA